MNNQRGGVISKVLFIPVGVALMIGFFFLGYYVGKYQSKTNQNEIVLPMPEIVSKNLPTQKEEFTFFRTLTDKENKTISIELKPRQEDPKNDQRQKEKRPPIRLEKRDSAPPKEAPTGRAPAKKEPESGGSSAQNGRFTLQIASYPERSLAEQDVKKMHQNGYSAVVVASSIQGRGTWYRVRVGSFSSRSAAEKLQREIQSKIGVTALITSE